MLLNCTLLPISRTKPDLIYIEILISVYTICSITTGARCTEFASFGGRYDANVYYSSVDQKVESLKVLYFDPA